ncbi:Spo11/DNA topoisomerase VI subunit A [Lipomyces japonicus]|uniref:Spo11/DNA topoisomerase VI subunit A n=1 Tax=Lipomyces japonicus TaxID=56871 RepID=UPI0034CFFA42
MAGLDRDRILQGIESIVDNLLSSVEQSHRLQIELVLPAVSSRASSVDRFKRVILEKKYSTFFPGKNLPASLRFAAILKLLDIISENVTNGSIVTKRDIYYQDVDLFKNQTAVDRHIDNIARTLGATRAMLGIVAAQKGLVCGFMSFNRQDGVTLCTSEIHLIPGSDMIVNMATYSVKYLLIIEKEAVFRNLFLDKFFDRQDLGHGILVTGKGYPDLFTRQFVSKLANENEHIPILTAVDSDPFGIDIAATYKYGSATLAHEGESAIVGKSTWIGVELLDYDQGWTPLTNTDRKKAVTLLQKEVLQSQEACNLRLAVYFFFPIINHLVCKSNTETD